MCRWRRRVSSMNDRPEGEDLGVLAVAAALQGVVRVLAQPFKDHPGFDAAWLQD
jgi:hypothetical protein